jgi:hypothetical protein
MISLAATALGLAAATCFAAPAAHADTTTFHNLHETFRTILPCIGPATVTTTFNGDFHESSNPGGGYHETDNTVGSFTAVLDAGGTASGHFTIWSAFNTADGVNGVGTFNFNGQVTSGVAAGTEWHENSQYVGPVDLGSDPKLAFDHFHCS